MPELQQGELHPLERMVIEFHQCSHRDGKLAKAKEIGEYVKYNPAPGECAEIITEMTRTIWDAEGMERELSSGTAQAIALKEPHHLPTVHGDELQTAR